MEALKILENKSQLDWDYDVEADVLYISVTPSRSAVGVDIGEVWSVRYDEVHDKVVGLTIVGIREKCCGNFHHSPPARGTPLCNTDNSENPACKSPRSAWARTTSADVWTTTGPRRSYTPLSTPAST